jgi:hypothetical protein
LRDHAYITQACGRRQCVKEHDNAEGVRRSIRYYRGRSTALAVFELDYSPGGQRMYVEVPRSLWGTVFGEEA